jgi:hypothetical protein
VPGSNLSDQPAIDLLTIDGRLIKNIRIRQEHGNYSFSLPAEMTGGIYILSLKDKLHRHCFKIMVY